MSLEMSKMSAIEYIIEYKEKHDGCAPSVRDIAGEIGCGVGYVKTVLAELEIDGDIKRIKLDNGKRPARGIMVTGGRWRLGNE